MTIPYNLLAVLVAAATVFALSVLGSFIVWMNTAAWDGVPETDSQAARWKWMVIVFLIILSFMLLTRPE